jgi:mttA/Hcf106 family
MHIAFLLVILLLVFGAKRLPETGRSLGSGLFHASRPHMRIPNPIRSVGYDDRLSVVGHLDDAMWRTAFGRAAARYR